MQVYGLHLERRGAIQSLATTTPVRTGVHVIMLEITIFVVLAPQIGKGILVVQEKSFAAHWKVKYQIVLLKMEEQVTTTTETFCLII